MSLVEASESSCVCASANGAVNKTARRILSTHRRDEKRRYCTTPLYHSCVSLWTAPSEPQFEQSDAHPLRINLKCPQKLPSGYRRTGLTLAYPLYPALPVCYVGRFRSEDNLNV